MCVASCCCSHRRFRVPKKNCNEIKNEIKKNIPAARDVSRLEPLLLLVLLCCRFDALRWPGVVVVPVVVVEVVKLMVVAKTKSK